MPSYKNITDQDIVLNDLPFISATKIIKPNEVFASELILDHITGLTRIDDLPLFNPLVRIQKVNFAGANDIQSVNILYRSTKQIVISEVTADSLEIYLSSMDNIPPFEILSGDILTFECRRNVDKIYMKSSSAGSCRVTEFKEKHL